MSFPTLSDDMDSSKFSVELEDSTKSEELEGGYTATRSGTTRRGRKIFKGGYTFISNADKLLLETHWDAMGGRSKIFSWINVQNGTTYLVRFKEKLAFKYVGRLTFQRWDCDFVLQEA